MKTFMAKKNEVPAGWHVVDATDKVLGRLAASVATILMGKHRPEYTPHVDTGEFVIIINATKVKLTSEVKLDRAYQTYSGYPSGQKTIVRKEMLATKPETVISEAVRRMLPKTKLARQMLSKLKVYAGSEHPHQAQQPKPLEL